MTTINVIADEEKEQLQLGIYNTKELENQLG